VRLKKDVGLPPGTREAEGAAAFHRQGQGARGDWSKPPVIKGDKIMKHFTFVAVAILAIAVLSGAAWSKDKGARDMVSQDLVCKDGNWEVVFPCGLPENTGNPEDGSYGTGNAFGKIKYDANSAGDTDTMRLQLHGLEPNSWYLVTLQDESGDKQFSENDAFCLFGIKGGGEDDIEWCDIALVQANEGGNVNTLVPTTSGLTGHNAPACAEGNVPGLGAAPELGTGSYADITMVVKNVGLSSDGTTPDCNTLASGGSAELFEADALPEFTAK